MTQARNPGRNGRPRWTALPCGLALGVALIAGPILAQERTPPERQTLLDLAYAIGESHALRQVCQGDADQFWRDRMRQLTETEGADSGFEARLTQSFNSGYVARQAQFPSCGPDSRRAELAVARKGETLARKLSTSVREVKRMGPDDPNLQNGDPDSMEQAPAPR